MSEAWVPVYATYDTVHRIAIPPQAIPAPDMKNYYPCHRAKTLPLFPVAQVKPTRIAIYRKLEDRLDIALA